MPTPAPKLKADGIVGQVNEILRTATHYLEPKDPRVLKLMHEAETMRKANAAAAYNAMGSVSQLVGDSEKAIYYIDNAIKLASGELVYLLNKCGYLANLGFFLEAQEVFNRVAKPELGIISRAWNLGYVCGAFGAMARHFERATEKLKFEFKGLDTLTALRAAHIFSNAGIEDQEIGSVLNVAGALLRERKLFYLGDVPQIRVYDGPDEEWFVETNYDVGVSSADAAAIYDRFVEEVVVRDPKASRALSVSIRAGGRENERSAA